MLVYGYYQVKNYFCYIFLKCQTVKLSSTLIRQGHILTEIPVWKNLNNKKKKTKFKTKRINAKWKKKKYKKKIER